MLIQNWFQPFQVSCQVWEAVAVLPAVRVSSASSHFVQISILLRQQFAKTDISGCAIYCTFYLFTYPLILMACIRTSEHILLSKQGIQRNHEYDILGVCKPKLCHSLPASGLSSWFYVFLRALLKQPTSLLTPSGLWLLYKIRQSSI